MIEQPILIVIALLYISLLFWVAWLAGKKRVNSDKPFLQIHQPIIYSLALAVYCSSWTFFGAVGQASVNVWSFLPIYLGPIFVFVVGYPFLRKLLITGEQQKVTSIADFLGSRYGKSQTLSALVAVLAIIGSLPYIALQLRAISMAWETISPTPALNGAVSSIDSAFIAALVMGLFAILFGTRQLEGRERNRGMVIGIALESMIKLLAFFVVSVFAFYLITQVQENTFNNTLPNDWGKLSIDINFIAQSILAALAIICLPRQFHMLVVESHKEQDLRTARWLFPLYLLLFSILVVPIAYVANQLFSDSNIAADSLALSLPVLTGSKTISVIAFIGGLSAATGMVIVASITLAIMISNELVAPIWLRLNEKTSNSVFSLGDNLKLIRRFSIISLLLLAWGVNQAFASIEALTEIGLIAFAASAQFAPALIIGLYWQKGHRNGALVGLLAGYLLWFYCLILPVVIPSNAIVVDGIFGIAWLRPEQLFTISFEDSLTHGVFWSLSINIVLYGLVSVWSFQDSKDQKQADAFIFSVDKKENSTTDLESSFVELSSIQVKYLRSLMKPFVGKKRLEELWKSYESHVNQSLLADDFTPSAVVVSAERTLAGVIGAATAQKTIKLLHQRQQIKVEEIVELVDDTSKKLRFNQHVLEATVETVSQAISVIDSDFNLIAWNSKYQDLFDYPKNLLFVGCPIAKLYYVNAQRGLYGADLEDLDAEVEHRIDLLRQGKAHHFERKLPNGKIIDVRSNPLPEGGYVSSYTDVTEYRAMLDALENSKSTLEERVNARTADLSNANKALEIENKRRANAETQLKELHAAKSRFLAHTSHDLMQPLNAARLFAGVMHNKLESNPADEMLEDLSSIENAIENAENLVDALREMSRLDQGNLKPNIESFSIESILSSLAQEYQLSIFNENLKFSYQKSSAVVCSDPVLLRRIVQNFLSNALRYSKSGKVLLGCRRRKQGLEIQVLDTGSGIEKDKQEIIFNEFERLNNLEDKNQVGLGLGLSIAKRSAELLQHSIDCSSIVTKGSVFSVLVPFSDSQANPKAISEIRVEPSSLSLTNSKVLCVDNDELILKGMQSLLKGWGAAVDVSSTFHNALQFAENNPAPTVVIIDYHLDDSNDGVSCWLAMSKIWRECPPAILISADTSEEVRLLAKQHNLRFLAKPVKPAALLNLLRVLAS